MSIIHRFLASAFGTPESRVLMVGLDASGRTTMLYRWKLGEVVTTIPTIGFNVEQVTHKKHSFTFWDVGGCDKIRPLWRHYFANTQFVIFVVDSNDRERMEEVEWSLGLMTCEDELRDTAFAIALNKQDLPNAMGVEEVTERLKLRALRNRVWKCFPCSAIKGEGIYEILEWMAAQAEGRGKDNATAPKPPAPATAPARERSLLEDWLEVEDEPDDEFLKKLAECTLDSWDHRTHLRIAWVLLERHGRREGMRLIFEGIKNFIDHSPHTKRSRGTTFHETMTYFWVHMVHYAMAATRNPTGDFKGFLVMNPQLSNGGMFLDYYRKETMLNNPEARTQVVLPDLKPLPSILSDVSGRGAGGAGGAGPAPRAPEAPAEVSDAAFMEAFEGRRLRSWGHEALIRVIAANLLARGRREGSKQTFAQLEAFMGEEGYHCTLTYFWIQMVDFAIARLLRRGKQPLCFRDVWEAAPELRNDRLPQEHYRSETLFSKGAAKSMVLPDLKPLPSIL